MTMVTLGIENLLVSPPGFLAKKRVGLLCNQASTDSGFRHSRDLIHAAFPGQLTCLFSPQHGFFGEKQDNMIESDHMRDPVTGLPFFSLYGETRRPTGEMLDHLDVLLIDLCDVGTRVYTFIHTMAYCLEAAAEHGKKVLILDRPNPIGGDEVEGNLLKADCASFVGLFPIPMRHGLTMGEMGLFINRGLAVNADVEVVPMLGWQRRMLFRDTGLPWLFPSPNMPTPESALVYPGQVIWEGTNISEGRGTTLPFELFGAPFFDHRTYLHTVVDLAGEEGLAGCFLRPLIFQPTSNKWTGQDCVGFQIHVTNPLLFKPYRTGLAMLQAALLLYPALFDYKKPPYEYEFERLPMDLILGDKELRVALEQGGAIRDQEEGWQEELRQYDLSRRKIFLYS